MYFYIITLGNNVQKKLKIYKKTGEYSQTNAYVNIVRQMHTFVDKGVIGI